MLSLYKKVPREIFLSSIRNQFNRRQLLNCRNAALFSTTKKINSETKQYKDIPTKKGFLPSTIELILRGGPNYLHEHCERRHKELGSIYREHLGPIELIFLSDTKLIQTVIANEGQFPHHNVPQAWIYYNKLNNIERGLFFQIGEPWAKLRKVFNKVMLADPHKLTVNFSKHIISINEDLLDIWKCQTSNNDKRDNNNSNSEIIINNVKPDLCKWSIESTGFILFGKRMGCVNFGKQTGAKLEDSEPQRDYRAEQLVKNVAEMFQETSKFQLLPVELAHKLKLKTWKRFENATKNMLRIANEYASENIRKVRSSLEKDTNISFCLTKDLLELNELSDEEVSRSLVDLIIAAADTTSNSLQWMLYLIAKYKHVQDKLLKEANILLSKYSNDNYHEKDHDDRNDDQALYLRAFMKEAARLYPTAPFLARTLDKEINLAGYIIPPGKPIVFSLYTTSRSERYFDEPNEFKPERWFRYSSSSSTKLELNNNTHNANPCGKKNHAYASLPFGIGTRMCIGRRAAELQMMLFLASFVNKFESSLLHEDCNIGIKLEMILCPEKPIRLKLKPRE